jgi:hypothetical protein
MRTALLLAALIPFSAHAAEKVVQTVQIDLDGDGVKDTVTEISVGGPKNILRVQLSKTKRTFNLANLLVNAAYGKQGQGCEGWVPSRLRAVANENGNGPAVQVIRQHGVNDGCDTNYSTHQENFSLAVDFNDQLPGVGPLIVKRIFTNDYTYAHADGENTQKTNVDFVGQSVSVFENCGYHRPDSRSREVVLAGDCKISATDFDKTGGVAPACAAQQLEKLWATLWPASESAPNDIYCTHGKPIDN